MFKMVEVVGRSAEGYSDAVKDAVTSVMARDENVHFFTVVEQRGACHGGKIEYQAVVKMAIDA